MQYHHLNIKNIIEILYKGRLNGFLSGKEPIRKEGIKYFVYESSPYKYFDIYTGSIIDGGQEVIFYEDQPIWCLVHYGGIFRRKNVNISKEVFHFLKKALLSGMKVNSLRGPRLYSESVYQYTFHIKGDFKFFKGVELIYRVEDKNELIYRKYIVGGILWTKDSIKITII